MNHQRSHGKTNLTNLGFETHVENTIGLVKDQVLASLESPPLAFPCPITSSSRLAIRMWHPG